MYTFVVNLSFYQLILLVNYVVVGYKQEITFFTEYNQAGDNITFSSSQPKLTSYENILSRSKSYCVSGIWFGFEQISFVGELNAWEGDPVRRCGNDASIQTKLSIRHLGASETTDSAISLYSGYVSTGKEVHADNETEGINTTPFEIRSYATTGTGNWTLYSGPNFTGNSTCARGFGRIYYDPYEPNVYSVSRGCDE